MNTLSSPPKDLSSWTLSEGLPDGTRPDQIPFLNTLKAVIFFLHSHIQPTGTEGFPESNTIVKEMGEGSLPLRVYNPLGKGGMHPD